MDTFRRFATQSAPRGGAGSRCSASSPSLAPRCLRLRRRSRSSGCARSGRACATCAVRRDRRVGALGPRARVAGTRRGGRRFRRLRRRMRERQKTPTAALGAHPGHRAREDRGPSRTCPPGASGRGGALAAGDSRPGRRGEDHGRRRRSLAVLGRRRGRHGRGEAGAEDGDGDGDPGAGGDGSDDGDPRETSAGDGARGGGMRHLPEGARGLDTAGVARARARDEGREGARARRRAARVWEEGHARGRRG